MNLKITRTGNSKYEIDSQIASILLEAFPDSFTRIEPRPAPQAVGAPPLPPKEPTFGVGMGRNAMPTLFLSLPGGETIPYQGSPADADAIWRVFRGVKLRPSKEILAQYKHAYEQNRVPVGPSR